MQNSSEITVRLLLCAYQSHPVWKHANLKAPYWRIYWNSCEGWWVRWEKQVQKLMPDVLVVIPPETPFSAHSNGRSDHLFIHFATDTAFGSVGPDLYSYALTDTLREIVETLISKERSEMQVSLSGRALCYYVLGKCMPSSVSESGKSVRIRKAVRFIEERLGLLLNNDEIASWVGMSTNGFVRLFSQEMGQSPHVWLLHRRIAYACELLHHSDSSIDTIAEECGFCDRAHFSKVFMKLRGVGPAAFRLTKE